MGVHDVARITSSGDHAAKVRGRFVTLLRCPMRTRDAEAIEGTSLAHTHAMRYDAARRPFDEAFFSRLELS